MKTKEKINKYWEENPEGELDNELSIIEKASGCERGEIKQIIRPIVKRLLSLQKQEILEEIEKFFKEKGYEKGTLYQELKQRLNK